MAALRLQCIFALCPQLGALHLEKRHIKRWVYPYLRSLYKRRLDAGPEPERHRSEWSNWNYDAEIYAFGKRLGEEFKDETLRKAFTHRSYIEKEEQKRIALGIDTVVLPLGLEDNNDLVSRGEAICDRYITAYLRYIYPQMYEEGIGAIRDFLMLGSTLANISRHIGTKDLVLCADFPPEESTLSKTFKAVVGAIEKDQGLARAEHFVRDFVLPQLIGKDLSELWKVVNPMGLLTEILQAQSRGLPEPRLLHQSAVKTVMSLYYVGIYSDKELIGQSPGETVTIAEEMAAHDALQRIMGVQPNRIPLKFGRLADSITLDYNKRNPSIKDLSKAQIPQKSGISQIVSAAKN